MSGMVLPWTAELSDDRTIHLAALLDSTHDIIFSVDRDLALVACNRAFAHYILTTWGIQAAPGKTAFDLPSRPHAEMWNGLLSRALVKGAFQTEIQFADSRWFEFIISPIRSNGSVLGVSAFGRDVTERKLADASLREAESALRESEALFRSFFQLPLVGFSIVHPGKPGIIANERLCQMFGYSADELSKMSWTEITHPDDLTKCSVQFDQLIAGQIRSYWLEKRYIRKDGSILWASIAVGCVRLPMARSSRSAVILRTSQTARPLKRPRRKPNMSTARFSSKRRKESSRPRPGGKLFR